MSLVFFESGLNGMSSLSNINLSAFTGNAADACGLQAQLVLDWPE